MPKALRDRTTGQLFAYSDALAGSSHQFEVVDFNRTPESAPAPAKKRVKASPLTRAPDLAQVAPEVPPPSDGEQLMLVIEPEAEPEVQPVYAPINIGQPVLESAEALLQGMD